MPLTEQEELELLELEREQSLAQRAADIHTDKRRLEPSQRLEVLKAQLSDPTRNPMFDSQLRAEIDALERKIPAPVAPRPSQSDVRRAEQPLGPMQNQELEERRFNAAKQQWMAKTGGVLKPGQTQNQAVTEWSGIPDPNASRAQGSVAANIFRDLPLTERSPREEAEAQHAAQTGELVDDHSLAYEAAKMLAGIGGFALAGPAGATAAELGTRYASLKYRLDAAQKAGMSEDEADSIFARELAKGISIDAVFNFGIPILGQWLAKLSGKVKLGEKFSAALEKMFGGAKRLEQAKIESRAMETDNPTRRRAVIELSKRTPGDYIPTPSQVRGETGAVEGAINKAFPKEFQRQEKALQEGAEAMRRGLLGPAEAAATEQPLRQAFGERVVSLADETVKATKERLRPAFKAADDLGIQVDMSGVAARAKAALAKDASVPNGKLEPVEREYLKRLVDAIERPSEGGAVIPGINPSSKVSAEAALDFISRQKEKLRSTTADWKPSEFFDTILNGLAKDADNAFSAAVREADAAPINQALGKTGHTKVLNDLLAARREYRKMNETVFDDAMKQALRKEAGGAPEDIGTYLWQNGKISRLEQLNELMGLAHGEKKLSAEQMLQMQRDVTRGFLREAVKSVDDAAKWSERLGADVKLADTWKTLTATPGGQELRDAMEVLSQAAQMATMRDSSKNYIPLIGMAAGRAAQGGLGVSYVTGAIHAPMAVAGLSIAAVMKMMSTAYTHGDKGTINLIAKVLRARNAGTAAGIQAMQAALLPALEKAAQKYGADDIFVAEGAEDMVEAPPGYGSIDVPAAVRKLTGERK